MIRYVKFIFKLFTVVAGAVNGEFLGVPGHALLFSLQLSLHIDGESVGKVVHVDS